MSKKVKAKQNLAKDVKPSREIKLVELKALAYDIYAGIQQEEKRLRAVNDLIREQTNELGKIAIDKRNTKEETGKGNRGTEIAD